MKRRRMLLWLALAVGGLALVALWPRGDLGRRVRLLDGTVLELKKVTVGTNHHFRYRSGWEQLLGVLPDKWEEKMTHRGAQNMNSLEPRIAFWLVWHSTNSAPAGYWRVLCDDNGVGNEPDWANTRTPVDRNTYLESFAFDQFPRRSKRLTLRFYGARNESATLPVPVAQFTVPNPFHTTGTSWTPEPLPITRRFEDVTVTLTECKVSVNQTNELAPPRLPLFGHLYLHFRVEPERTGLNDWRVGLVKLSDAGGNSRLIERPKFWNYSPGDVRMVLDKFLFSDDPVWKIQMEFYQDFAARKPRPDELRTIPDLPIADHHSKVKWTALTPAWFGARVSVYAVRYATAEGEAVGVGAQIEPWDQGHHFGLIEVRDAEGRSYQPAGPQDARSAGYWSVKLPADAKTATLTFQLRQGHWEEFLVRPEFPFAPAPAK